MRVNSTFFLHQYPESVISLQEATGRQVTLLKSWMWCHYTYSGLAGCYRVRDYACLACFCFVIAWLNGGCEMKTLSLWFWIIELLVYFIQYLYSICVLDVLCFCHYAAYCVFTILYMMKCHCLCVDIQIIFCVQLLTPINYSFIVVTKQELKTLLVQFHCVYFTCHIFMYLRPV